MICRQEIPVTNVNNPDAADFGNWQNKIKTQTLKNNTLTSSILQLNSSTELITVENYKSYMYC